MAVFASRKFKAPSLYNPDENTLFLLHGDTIEDSSMYSVPITNNGVTVSDAQSKFGGKSLYFNGSAYITIIQNNIIFGEADFTLEWWEFRTASMPDGGVFHQTYGNGIGFGFSVAHQVNGQLGLYIATTSSTWDAVSNPAFMGTEYLNQWIHRALVRSNGRFIGFQNGTKMSEVQSSVNLRYTPNPTIGFYNYNSGEFFSGYIDEFRISNVARWTSNFTPPTEPYKG